MQDSVDHYISQWAAQRGDLDLDAMGTVGRILRLSRIVNAQVKDYFAEFDMETWEFDVLATLRRSLESLTPKGLATSMMIGSSALTNRVDRLVARGLVTRVPVPGDRRSLYISLTGEGRMLVDSVVEGHVRNQRRILGELSDHDQEELDRLLRTLLVSLGDTCLEPAPADERSS